jgi:hypothetical protein
MCRTNPMSWKKKDHLTNFGFILLSQQKCMIVWVWNQWKLNESRNNWKKRRHVDEYRHRNRKIADTKTQTEIHICLLQSQSTDEHEAIFGTRRLFLETPLLWLASAQASSESSSECRPSGLWLGFRAVQPESESFARSYKQPTKRDPTWAVATEEDWRTAILCFLLAASAAGTFTVVWSTVVNPELLMAAEYWNQKRCHPP